MKIIPFLLLAPLAAPLCAQAWDIRAEAPFGKGQNLPAGTLQGTPVSGTLGTGDGVILTLSHRIVRVGPVLKFEWNAEYAQLNADGRLQQGPVSSGTRLRQEGLGAGINAQFWVPFTGFAGEAGLLERFQHYRFEAAGAAQDQDIARTWLRLGVRWNLPLPGIGPYLAASWQAPLHKDQPVQTGPAATPAGYLGAQGAGQEFQSLWTLGVGVTF